EVRGQLLGYRAQQDHRAGSNDEDTPRDDGHPQLVHEDPPRMGRRGTIAAAIPTPAAYRRFPVSASPRSPPSQARPPRHSHSATTRSKNDTSIPLGSRVLKLRWP